MKTSKKQEYEINTVIYDLNDLYALQETYKFSFFPVKSGLKLKLGQLTEPENTKWQHKLLRHYLACGCKEGAATAIFFLMTYWLITIFSYGLNTILKWEIWLISFICLFAGAVIGKIIGMVYSRYVFKKNLRELLTLILHQKSSNKKG
jgi:hypothetical protein